MKPDMATPGETMLERLRRREGPFRQRETLPDPGPRPGSEPAWTPTPPSGTSSSGGGWIPRAEAGIPVAPSDADAPTFEVREVGGDAGAPAADLVREALGEDGAAALDRFDRVQLEDVLRVCKDARSLADAGRTLFAASRAKKASSNDGDRLRKYLRRFDLTFDGVR